MIKDRVQRAIKYFNDEVFTIEDMKDPTWETMCQKIGDQLIEKLINEGKSYHYILITLNGLNTASRIEELLLSQSIELPISPKTKESILDILNKKLENVKIILKKQKDGVKW